MKVGRRAAVACAALVCLFIYGAGAGRPAGSAQEAPRVDTRSKARRGGVRSVTIPVTIIPRSSRAGSELLPVNFFEVAEDGEPQAVLSVRGEDNVPLSIAILVQDDVVASINNEIEQLASFIRRLPRGSRVLVGYLRSGSLQVRQKFTVDLERAAGSLRMPVGSPAVSPYNPYVEVVEALKRFESLPTGRRAILLISDGLDISRGVDGASPSQSVDLQRAINEAQRRGVAIYSIYAPTASATALNNRLLVGYAQSSLNRFSDETGGKAFFQGTSAPVSIEPFLREVSTLLSRQLALTYLSTHPGNGYHRITVKASTPAEVDLRHPSGYTRK